MAKITFNYPPLTVDLPDLVKGVTVMKRRAVNIRLIYDLDPKFISIKWLEKKYCKNDDGSFGDEEGQIEKVLTAKDYIYVDVTDGTQLCHVNEEYTTVTSEPDQEENPGPTEILNSVLEGKNYALETDFYNHMGFAVPIIVNNIITQRILRDYL